MPRNLTTGASAPAITVTARDSLGVPLEFGQITVTTIPNGTAATLYADPDLATTIPNPGTADGHGNFTYYALPGTYRHTITGSSWQIEDVEVTGLAGGGSSAVSSVNGKVGTVNLTSTDVSADPSGAASTAQTAAQNYSDTKLAQHVSAVDPHGDRAYSDSQLAGHVAAADPHGDRAWATPLLNAKAPLDSPVFTTAVTLPDSSPAASQAWVTAHGAAVPDASTGVKGVIALNGGDGGLGGTADNPQVVGWDNKVSIDQLTATLLGVQAT